APFRTTARAATTWLSTPMPPRHTGRSPPTRWMSASREREVKVDGALPKNQLRGSTGRACITTNGSIQPRWAAPTSGWPAWAGRSSRPGGSMRNRNSPNSPNRASRRRSRYRIDARASGSRPSQSRPSFAPSPRDRASASGDSRPGGGRRRAIAGSGVGGRASSIGAGVSIRPESGPALGLGALVGSASVMLALAFAGWPAAAPGFGRTALASLRLALAAGGPVVRGLLVGLVEPFLALGRRLGGRRRRAPRLPDRARPVAPRQRHER